MPVASLPLPPNYIDMSLAGKCNNYIKIANDSNGGDDSVCDNLKSMIVLVKVLNALKNAHKSNINENNNIVISSIYNPSIILYCIYFSEC